jgi:hypothetical protein
MDRIHGKGRHCRDRHLPLSRDLKSSAVEAWAWFMRPKTRAWAFGRIEDSTGLPPGRSAST